jgi:hypothetical protein
MNFSKKIEYIGIQFYALVLTGIGFLFWGILEWFIPNFFSPFKWQYWSNDIVGSIANFFPLFIWAFVANTLILFFSSDSIRSREYSDEDHLILDSCISILAGVWEELNYRCVYILLAMITIVLFNYCWFIFLYFLIFIGIVGLLAVLMGEGNGAGGLLIGIIAVILLLATWNLGGAASFFYSHIVFPILSWISFGSLDSILYYSDNGATPLFCMGIVSANASFRNGHKYQGPIGWVNSWVVGFVFAYAMLYHGLWVAIAIHALYDLEIAIVVYLGHKLKG